MRPLADGLAIDPRASALEALRKMSEVDSGRLMVVDQGKFVGLITRGGLARFVQMKTLLDRPKADRGA
jgi:predicted transcriptional regulator